MTTTDLLDRHRQSQRAVWGGIDSLFRAAKQVAEQRVRLLEAEWGPSPKAERNPAAITDKLSQTLQEARDATAKLQDWRTTTRGAEPAVGREQFKKLLEEIRVSCDLVLELLEEVKKDAAWVEEHDPAVVFSREYDQLLATVEQIRSEVMVVEAKGKPWPLRWSPSLFAEWGRYESAAASALAVGAIAGVLCGWLALAPLWVGALAGYAVSLAAFALALTGKS